MFRNLVLQKYAYLRSEIYKIRVYCCGIMGCFRTGTTAITSDWIQQHRQDFRLQHGLPWINGDVESASAALNFSAIFTPKNHERPYCAPAARPWYSCLRSILNGFVLNPIFTAIKKQNMKKYVKPILWTLLGLLLLGQFIRPEKNQSNDQTNHIRTKIAIPEPVEAILEVACYDCHSNYTRYPWYAAVQPVAGWLAGHIKHGKDELNFSELATRRVAVQNHKLEEIIEMVDEGKMPLASYTWTHRDAVLTQEQKNLLNQWAQSAMNKLKDEYPADSLRMRKR